MLGGVFLALMVGHQQGTPNDFHVAFKDAWFRSAGGPPRVIWFLLIGAGIFLLITFWPLVAPYLGRSGVKALGAGMLVVIAAQTVMNWYDPLAANGNGRFNGVRKAVDKTSGLSSLTHPFFTWLAWVLLLVIVVLCGVEIIGRRKVAGYAAAAVAIVGGVLAYLSHRDVLHKGGGIDHSLGMYFDIIGFLILAGAGLTASLSRAEHSDTRAFARAVTDFRPGLPIMVVALVWGLLAMTTTGWFGASGINKTFSQSKGVFIKSSGVSSLTIQYLHWLGWTLFIAAMVVGLAATWLRNELVAWVGGLIGLAGVVITFFTIKSMTQVAAKAAPQYGKSWQNLGVGGFVACMVFSLVIAAMSMVGASARAERTATRKQKAATVDENALPFTRMVQRARSSSTTRALIVIGIAVALFYPPTLPVTWQNVLVTQVGVYVLLAIGLNVVVGWAGLLDLGYIAFYEIGSYTTAYLTGALPVKPPHWLHPFHSPLWSIPFAIVVCLIAGVLLGAPTLRLRGDYLAIVTLGFGEIIQQVAVINPGGFTGGPQGPTVSHPHLHIGGLHITWGQDNLPYWYLLLIMLVIVLVLFYRLEGSRLGRAWAAIREDEVAAQASGVNTTRVKLLAFAIGASTSGLAGVFFATQVGYFDPSLFTLQASILIVAYVVFGGMGSLYGAMAGAAVLTWLPQFLKNQVPANDRQMWVGALVLAMMVFRPAGLLPAKRRRAELEGFGEGAESAETGAVPRAGAM
jgi:ABC-type branched-subunit amino acid transport system permease subunit